MRGKLVFIFANVIVTAALLLPSFSVAFTPARAMPRDCHSHSPARKAPHTCCSPQHPLPTAVRTVSPQPLRVEMVLILERLPQVEHSVLAIVPVETHSPPIAPSILRI